MKAQSQDLFIRVAYTLCTIGSVLCIEKAELLRKLPRRNPNLHLRNLDLTNNDVKLIAQDLQLEKQYNNNFLRSVSFSYNRLLGDEGTINLLASFPDSISELGMVSCGIGDEGGRALLDWAEKAPNLSMLCIEQNRFSKQLKSDFVALNQANPDIYLDI